MKYDRLERNTYKRQNDWSIFDMMDASERVIWKGKPKKSAFLLENIFGALLPFVLIWAAVDGFVLYLVFSNAKKTDVATLAFTGVFFLFHLTPVWIWIGQILTARKKYQKTEYVLTDRRILIKSGVFSTGYSSILLTDVRGVHIHRGLVDRLCHVGDLRIETSSDIYATGERTERTLANSIIDVENPTELFELITKTVALETGNSL